MAIGLRRKVRLDSRRAAQKRTRRENGRLKNKERLRRDARMSELLKRTDPAQGYHPALQSWISDKLGKPFSRINEDEIRSLVA